MRIVYCEQGSPEWFQCRAGHITSSVIADVMRKKADAVTRERLKDRLLGEILSGKPDDEKGFSSKHMEAGKEREPFARTAYELRENVMVETVGFVYHPTIPRCGTSPDSMVGDDGVLEIKCPLRATHLRYIREDRIPPEYMKQCIWHLVCTRRKWLDFVSYHPDLPEHLQLFVKRIEVDDEVVAMFEKEARQFLDEVNGLRVQYDALDKVTACR